MSAAERRAAVERYLAGEATGDIAHDYRVDPGRVRAWVREAGEQVRSKPGPPKGYRSGGGGFLMGSQQKAVDAYLGGRSSRDVGREFGVTGATILALVRQAGHAPRGRDEGYRLSRQPLTERQREAVSTYLSGRSSADVAKEFDVSPPTILAWVRRSGHTSRERVRSVTSTRETAAVALYLGGHTADEVAAEFGVSRQSVVRWLRKAGHAPRRPGRRSAQLARPMRSPYRMGARQPLAILIGKLPSGLLEQLVKGGYWTVGSIIAASDEKLLAAVRGMGPRRLAMVRSAADPRMAVERYLAGDAIKDIASDYGVGSKRVRAWIQEAGEQVGRKRRYRRPLTERQKDAVDTYMGGRSSTEVGREFGVSAATVLSWVRRAGYTARGRDEAQRLRRPPLTGRQRQAVAVYLEGSSSPEVGREFGASATAVLEWVRRSGHEPRSRGRRTQSAEPC